jgi:uncharacterized protein (DUF302 family)
MRYAPRILAVLCLIPVLAFGLADRVAAQEVLTHGQAYVIYLPGELDFKEVVERLKSELGGQNWEVMDIHHIDMGMKKYGLDLDNKLLLACKSQYLAQAIEEDPYITLIIPCRFTVFREAGSDGQPGRIVIGVADPVFEARGMDIQRYKAAEKAAEELKAVLENMARFYAPAG